MPRHFDSGYPKNFGDPHFGLYQPVLDCFLLTVCDLAQAQEIKMLASSRYSLYVVDLVCAENYAIDLIDNSCCENWTLSNKEMIQVGASHHIAVLKSDCLVTTNTQDSDVTGEKLYLQEILYHVKYYFDMERFTNIKIHDWIDGIIDYDFADQDYIFRKECIKKIKKILYLGVDLVQMEDEITQIKSQIQEYH